MRSFFVTKASKDARTPYALSTTTVTKAEMVCVHMSATPGSPAATWAAENTGYGICVARCGSFFMNEPFTGTVGGHANRIPGRNETSGNSQGSVCPIYWPDYPGNPWPDGFIVPDGAPQGGVENSS